MSGYDVTVSNAAEGGKGHITIAKEGMLRKKRIAVIDLGALILEAKYDNDADRLFVTTAHSDNEDNAALICYQVSTGQELWRVTDVSPGGTMVVNDDEQWVTAGKPFNTGKDYIVRVDYEGVVLERNPRSGYVVVDQAEEARDAGDLAKAAELYGQALEMGISENTRASVYRAMGEMAEEQGAPLRAIEYYARALELNPRVGVKRRLAALQKGG